MSFVRQRSLMSYLVVPLLASVLSAGFFGIVWLRSNIVSTEYRISELENGKMERMRETKMLMAERASVLSMKKAEKRIVTELGLAFPDRKKVLYVDIRKTGPQRASVGLKQSEVR